MIAAQNITYPHETWLLDDGNRPQMKQLAEELGCHYLARNTNRGAKPGNLNHALQYSKADYIAVIDCDHIAQRDYLDRLLGYFDDPQIAFVQAPQDYYNTDAFQFRNDQHFGLLWHDQTNFFASGQVGRDNLDATTCCGTSTIVRRRVVDEIGGFPEQTVTEDIHLAIKAQKLGYKSVYYPLPLAYGVAPVDLGEFQKQRLRWGQGNVQSIREEGLPFTTKLTLAQNICYTYLAFLYAEGWARLVFYLAPPIVIFTGLMPFVPTHDFLWYFLPFFFITVLFFEELGRGHNRFYVNEQMAMARFPVFIASTFAVFRSRIKWQVSSKEFIGHFQLYLLAPQLAVFFLNLGAAIWAISNPNSKLIEEYSSELFAFGLMWCGFNCLLAVEVVRNAIRCAKNKRADYRFSLKLPFQISIDGADAVIATTNRISASGMSFTVDQPVDINSKSTIEGNLFMPGITIPLEARIESDHPIETMNDQTTVRCEFIWSGANLKDRLDMSLHACVWHRKLNWAGAFFLTPLQRLCRAIGTFQDVRPPMDSHKTVLYQTQGEKSPDTKLALVLPGEDDGELSLIVYEPLDPNQELDLIWPKEGHNGFERIKIGNQISPKAVASAGPVDVKMFTYTASALKPQRPNAP